MLQPHSLLWHYLWVGPQVLQLALAIVLWRRKLNKQFPVFFAYLVFEAIEQLTLCGMDALPSIDGTTWWLACCVGLVIEGFIRLGVAGELFFHLLQHRPSIAKLGRLLITCAGAVLVLVATLVAAYAPVDTHQFAIGYRANLLQQTLYMIESGLILFLFLFAASFKLSWDRATLGIGLGRGISSSVHLATWAVMANGGLEDKRYLLDFLNMATYQVCVLLWFYFLLVPQKSPTTSAVSLPENNLDIWNRELERLLQR
ncbi:MAG TPA: hypothetical protein VMF10_08435 [Candidatus Aquilonibacter sp.]|nr:hypothetical protein [Candidatus Aquilonibacter sp.]